MPTHCIKLSSEKVQEILQEAEEVLNISPSVLSPEFREPNAIDNFITEMKDNLEINGYNDDVLNVSFEQLIELKNLISKSLSKDVSVLEIDEDKLSSSFVRRIVTDYKDKHFEVVDKMHFLVWGQFQREISLYQILNGNL